MPFEDTLLVPDTIQRAYIVTFLLARKGQGLSRPPETFDQVHGVGSEEEDVKQEGEALKFGKEQGERSPQLLEAAFSQHDTYTTLL